MSFVYQNSPSLTSSATVSVSSNTMLNSGVTLTVPSNITSTTGYVTLSGSNGMSYQDIKPATIHVQGTALFDKDADFKGNITVKGVDLLESLKRIEERLNLLQPNTKLEAEWDELRKLGEQYRQLERDMLEKLEMVELLKRKY